MGQRLFLDCWRHRDRLLASSVDLGALVFHQFGWVTCSHKGQVWDYNFDSRPVVDCWECLEVYRCRIHGSWSQRSRFFCCPMWITGSGSTSIVWNLFGLFVTVLFPPALMAFPAINTEWCFFSWDTIWLMRSLRTSDTDWRGIAPQWLFFLSRALDWWDPYSIESHFMVRFFQICR